MEEIINYLLKNKEWLFSGIGVVIIGFVLKLFTDKKKDNSQSMSNSSGIQAGGNVNINSNNDKKDNLK